MMIVEEQTVSWTDPEPDEAFAAMEARARELKSRYIDLRIEWYQDHTAGPRFCFRWAGIITILCSVTLPAIASAEFPYKALALSVMSIAVAALTGLSSFYKWERTWRANSTAQVALQQHVAKWELELAKARLLVSPSERTDHIYKATSDLLVNASNVVTSESEGFFSGLSFPQQNTAAKQ
jgi:hypothetical protein